jgi:hypothetical protein
MMFFSGTELTKRLYDKAIESLKDADFMSVHSRKLQMFPGAP